MEYVSYKQLDASQLTQMKNMLSRCFHIRNIALTNEYKYLLSKSTDIIISMAAVKYDPASKSASLWNVCATSLGKIIHATKKLLEFGLPQILLHEDNKCWLVLEFENPYWTRALSLYTSLGFINIITGSNQFKKVIGDQYNVESLLKKGIILYTDYKIFYKIKDDPIGTRGQILSSRNKADGIRKKKYNREYGGVGLPADMAIFGKEIISFNKEYAGYLTVDDNFNFDGIGNITGGNPIYPSANFPAFSEIYDTSRKSIFHFHTHPLVTNQNNNLSFNPPSVTDINFLFQSCKENLLRGYIFSTNGIFAYGLSKYAQCLTDFDNIIEQYKIILESMIDIRRDVGSVIGSWLVDLNDDQIENILIDYYIESATSIEYDGHSVFDIKYWPYSFLMSGNVLDSFFISKKLPQIGNVKSSVLFSDTTTVIPVFDAIQTGETLACSQGYIGFLLGARQTNENDVKLKNCLPYSYIDLDPLFKKYLASDLSKRENIISQVAQGLPFRRVYS